MQLEGNIALVTAEYQQIILSILAELLFLAANTFTLSVATEDFDYAADYVNNGNINVINLNLQVDGNFSYNDAVETNKILL